MGKAEKIILLMFLSLTFCAAGGEDIIVGKSLTKQCRLRMSSAPPNRSEAENSYQALSTVNDGDDQGCVSIISDIYDREYYEYRLRYNTQGVANLYGEKTGVCKLCFVPAADINHEAYLATNTIWVFEPQIDEGPHYFNTCAPIAQFLGLNPDLIQDYAGVYPGGFDATVRFSLLPDNEEFTQAGEVRLQVGESYPINEQQMAQGVYTVTSSVTEPSYVMLMWRFDDQVLYDTMEPVQTVGEFYEAVFPAEGVSVPYSNTTMAVFSHMYPDTIYPENGYQFVSTTWDVIDFSREYSGLPHLSNEYVEVQNQGTVNIFVPDAVPAGIYPVRTRCACSDRNLNVVKVYSVSAGDKESLENDEKELFIEYSADAEGNSTTCIELQATPTPEAAWPEDFPDWQVTLPGGSVNNLSDEDGKGSFSYTPETPGKYVFQAYCGNRIRITVYVIRLQMVPDWNHDRKIDSQDEGRVAGSNPFRFWINDDDDDGDIAGDDSDVPGQGSLLDNCNHEDSSVNGRCDLLDFFPVWLDLNETLSFLSPGDGVLYKLRQKDSALKAVYTDLTKATAGSFLTTSNNTCGSSFDQNSYEARCILPGIRGATLNTTFLNKIATNPDKGILMMEGAKESALPLVLEIWKDGEKVFEKEMAISISGVEDMYRYKNLRTDGNGGADRDTAENMPDELTEDYAAIFVHGFNVDADGARAVMSEVFKRLYQSGYKGRFVGIGWYGDCDEFFSNIGPSEYHESITTAFSVADEVKAVIDQVKQNVASTVDVIVHSAGNVAVSSAVQDHGSTFRSYIALDAAVGLEYYGSSAVMITNADGSCSLTGIETNMTSDGHFDTGYLSVTGYPWCGYDVRLHSSEWYRRFPEDDPRSKLTWRNRFKNVGSGNPVAYNFYSDTEEVLRNYNQDDLFHPGFTEWLMMTYNLIPWISNLELEAGDHYLSLYAWVKQEKLKGRKDSWLPYVGGLPGAWCGWGFNEEGRFIDEILWTIELGPKSPEEMLEYLTGSDSEEFLESLKYDPLFRPEPEVLFNAEASPADLLDDDSTTISGISDEVEGCTFANWLLANAFPARTWCMGANANERGSWERKNFNMSASYMTDIALWPRYCLWPSDSNIRPEWHHSDFKDIAYFHVYKLYDKWVEIMEAP